GQLQVEPVAGAVAVHRGDQQLSRSDGRALLRPGHGVHAGGRPAAVGEHLPFRCLARCPFRASSTERTPPPTVKGMKTTSAVRETTSTIVRRLSEEAVMSRKTSSSAPWAS